MDAIFTLASQSLVKVWGTLQHNWPYLLVSVLIAVLLKLYLKPAKITAFLLRHQRAGVIGATAAAVATPLCSCGSTAVILGMMASTMPWAPIVAFMVASPLSSPEGMVYSAGLFGWPFALAYFGASILLGLVGGAVTSFAERRGWLANQSRFDSQPTPKKNQTLAKSKAAASCCAAPLAPAVSAANSERGSLIFGSPSAQTLAEILQPSGGCDCSTPDSVDLAIPTLTCGCSASELSQPTNSAPPCCGSIPAPITSEPSMPSCECSTPVPLEPVTPVSSFVDSSEPAQTGKFKFDWVAFLKETWAVSKKLMFMFVGFAFIGYFLNGLIPSEWIGKIFGGGSIYSVPLAAVLGLPLYINSEASLPLVSAMLENGMSQGAAMAFLITGAGTSIGALGGALTIARWRVVALVVVVLTVGAILAGYAYNLVISFGWV